jgi:anaphase-promoting complex subunit 4
MIVGTRDGNIHLSIYDSFIIGSLKAPVISDGIPSNLVLHASNEQYSTHALLMQSPTDEGGLSIVPMDLRFVSSSSDYLSLLASRSTALHNLLRYIHEVHALMISEWKSSQDLPSKFLRNINEALKEKGSGDIVQSLYHSVATGHTFPAVKEWLVDELTERVGSPKLLEPKSDLRRGISGGTRLLLLHWKVLSVSSTKIYYQH